MWKVAGRFPETPERLSASRGDATPCSPTACSSTPSCEASVFAFVDAALTLLRPGGRLLVGDLPERLDAQALPRQRGRPRHHREYTGRDEDLPVRVAGLPSGEIDDAVALAPARSCPRRGLPRVGAAAGAGAADGEPPRGPPVREAMSAAGKHSWSSSATACSPRSPTSTSSTTPTTRSVAFSVEQAVPPARRRSAACRWCRSRLHEQLRPGREQRLRRDHLHAAQPAAHAPARTTPQARAYALASYVSAARSSGATSSSASTASSSRTTRPAVRPDRAQRACCGAATTSATTRRSATTCFISSHVGDLGLRATVGDNCFLGVNATLANNIKIGARQLDRPGRGDHARRRAGHGLAAGSQRPARQVPRTSCSASSRDGARRKLGRVYCADGERPWAVSHAYCPTALLWTTSASACSVRSSTPTRIGRCGWVDVDARQPDRVLAVSEQPALDVGAAGHVRRARRHAALGRPTA